MKIITAAFMVIVTLGISSCGKKDDATPKASDGFYYAYAPTKVGQEVVYNVSEITKDGFNGLEDTIHYQLREVVESEFSDLEGRPSLRIERYVREDTASAWFIQDVWSSTLLGDRFEKNEENTVYIKLRFPIKDGLEWNGNLLNQFPAQTYRFTSINIPTVVSGLTFDSTLTVLQNDYEDLLEKKYEVEQYAAGVGLVYKEQIHIEKNFNSPGSIISQRKYKQTLVSFKN
ncbi:MAG: hypothetical protein ACK5C5_03705 [Bacteroidota bacterium]|jgi:hypothetical protein